MMLATDKSDHLLLLIGSNPLPNAVAGKLLVKEGATITLLHSRDSAPVAERLSTWLKAQHLPNVRMREIEESDAVSIAQTIVAELGEIDSRHVGLHYTGGTKAMSVHAYHAVKQWAKESNRQPFFSYLDARELEIVFDPHDPLSGEQGRRVPVCPEVALGLADLLSLHGWRLTLPAVETPILPRTASELARVVSDTQAERAWKTWLEEKLFALCQRDDNSGKWKNANQLRSTEVPFPDSSVLAGVTEALCAELGRSCGDICIGDAATVCGYNNPEDFCKWLNGLWLESLVLGRLKECPAAAVLHDVCMNLLPAPGPNVPHRFEFDIAAVAGYQLFALSCSTMTRPRELKLKLFEALMRARQLGGDEARLALVCCSKDPASLEAEVRRDVDPEGRIRVFGARQLPNLAAELGEWIREQSKGV